MLRARLANHVEVRYPPELPITDRIYEIREAIVNFQIVVISGKRALVNPPSYYPVEVRYQPFGTEDDEATDHSQAIGSR